MTPLCSDCDYFRDGCRFCSGIPVTKPVEIYRGSAASSSTATEETGEKGEQA